MRITTMADDADGKLKYAVAFFAIATLIIAIFAFAVFQTSIHGNRESGSIERVQRRAFGLYAVVIYGYKYAGNIDFGRDIFIGPNSDLFPGKEVVIRVNSFPRITALEDYVSRQLAGIASMGIISLLLTMWACLKVVLKKRKNKEFKV